MSVCSLTARLSEGTRPHPRCQPESLNPFWATVAFSSLVFFEMSFTFEVSWI